MGCWALDKQKAYLGVKYVEEIKNKLYHIVGDDGTFDYLDSAQTCIVEVMLLNKADFPKSFFKSEINLIIFKNAVKNIKKDKYRSEKEKREPLEYAKQILTKNKK